MAKQLFILCFMLVGFLIVPKLSVACNMGHNMKMPCCQSKTVAHVTSENLSPSQKEQVKSPCNRGCNHSSCQCSSVSTSFAVSSIQVHKIILNISGNNKFNLTENATHTGFHSIWQPPKIS